MFTSSIASSLLSIANSLKKLAETEEYEPPAATASLHDSSQRRK